MFSILIEEVLKARFAFLLCGAFKDLVMQGTNAKKFNCGRVYPADILKTVLSGRNL